MDLKLPYISESTPDGKIEQLRSYLFQMVSDLNYMFSQKVDATVYTNNITTIASMMNYSSNKLTEPSGDLLNYLSTTISTGFTPISTTYATGFPSNKYTGCFGEVYKTSDTRIMVRLFSNDGEVASNVKNGSTWSGWITK